ncbi:ChaN family lipoprotein [Kamptonema formosum]|uniref:ChaN family lipoprotein n=1 Tax=Kamptonema formosum TaxID=331992 RepID=UPI00034C2B00|nr:ChaN family lipoprotein [Oscillatoria sp. PCC 10802]
MKAGNRTQTAIERSRPGVWLKNIRQFGKLCATSLGILLLCAFPASAEKISSPLAQQALTRQQVQQHLAPANVVYLGETHDSPEDHLAQLQIIQELHRLSPKIAIAMEMFQRPYQGALDDYLAGKIAEGELVERTEYERRWGFPWEYYAPILRFAKENRLPVLALNTPSEVTRQVSRAGLSSLTPEQRQHIPPISEILTGSAEYRQMVLESFQAHQRAGYGSAADSERFFLAQVLWDETMAEKIAQFLAANPDYQVVALAGQAHIVCGYGIPSRVARRVSSANFLQRLVLLNPDPELSCRTDKPVADFFWFSS